MTLSKGLTAHWTMDSHDIEGDTIIDRSSSKNHLTMNGGVTTGVDGIIGDCVELDGVDDELRFDQSITMDRNGATLSFHVKPNSTTSQTLFRDTSTTVKLIELRSDRINCEPNQNCNRFDNRSYSITTNWHHLAVQFDGASAYWYLNGEYHAEANYGQVTCGGANATEMVDDTKLSRIGSPAYNNWFDGRIADVRFYDRTLSASEIRALGNMRSSRHLRA